VLERGRAIFVNRCTPCHGSEGHGNGPVSKYFPPAPDLAYATVVARSDGYIFGTITLGGKAMPPQRDGLTDRDRWSVVDYVREIQRKAKEAPQ
jgi:mono/diheme cytochrome c family protein